MFSTLPVHVSLPNDSVQGATLLDDGGVRLYGGKMYGLALPIPITITDGVLSGPQDGKFSGPTQWTIAADGHLVDESPLDPASGRGFSAISPDGNWLAGSLPPTVPGQLGDPIVWQRGSSTYTRVNIPPGMTGTPYVLGISNSGDVLYWAGNGTLQYFAWNHATGLLPLQSLYKIEGSTHPDAANFRLIAMSADGSTIVGTSGSSSLFLRATEWIDGVAHELPSGGHAMSFAGSISNDGRIIGGYVGDGDIKQAAVWVDGTLHVLTDASDPFDRNQMALAVVDGVGGDPNAWAAIGWNLGSLWLARSDGIVHPLRTYLPENYGLSLTGDNQVRALLASNDALYVVTFEDTIPGMTAEGYGFGAAHVAGHVLILPNNFNLDPTNHLDLNGDQIVSPADALIVINALNTVPSATLLSRPELRQAAPKIDVDGDGELSPSDALPIIDFLNSHNTSSSSSATAEGESTLDTTQLDLLALTLLAPQSKKK